MKKISRRSFLMAAGSVAAISMLAACGDDSSSAAPASSAAGSDASSAAADPTQASGQLVLGIWPEETAEEAIQAHVETYVPNFNAKYPNVEVVPAYYKYAPDTYVAMATAGNAPTIFESWFTEPEKLIRNELVRDITAAVTARGWDKSMNASIRDLLSDADGNIYGVPRDAYALGLMINVQLFKDAGLVNDDGSVKYPTTWDEVYEDSKIIREKTGKAGFMMQASDGGGGWHWSTIAWNFGADHLVTGDAENGYTANLNTPEAVAAMEWVRKMVKDKCVTDDPTVENWGTGFDHIAAGTAAMYIAANDAVDQPSYRGMGPDGFFLAPMPAGPGKGHYALSGGTPYFFSPDATDEELEWALDYLVIMGKSPEVTDDARNGWIADAEFRQNAGIPVIQNFPAWTGKVVEEQNKIVAEYSNVDADLWKPYFDFVASDGALHLEEPGDTQTMYTQLNGVLQAIIADPDKADIQALLDKANEDYQTVLDAL